jgi:hypothetical protein
VRGDRPPGGRHDDRARHRHRRLRRQRHRPRAEGARPRCGPCMPFAPCKPHALCWEPSQRLQPPSKAACALQSAQARMYALPTTQKVARLAKEVIIKPGNCTGDYRTIRWQTLFPHQRQLIWTWPSDTSRGTRRCRGGPPCDGCCCMSSASASQGCWAWIILMTTTRWLSNGRDR